MEKKDILCPDCASTYISEKQYTKFGKCMSCYRREYMSKNNNVEYIKFVDLSDEEKVRITRQREIKRNSSQKIRNSNKVENKQIEKKIKVRIELNYILMM